MIIDFDKLPEIEVKKHFGGEERVSAGQVHYCPAGHFHQMINDTNSNAEFFSVVVK